MGIIRSPYLIFPLLSIMKLTKKGPRIEQIFPNIAKLQKADSWSLDFIFFTITLLLAAWIGPIKKPINKASAQKIS